MCLLSATLDQNLGMIGSPEPRANPPGKRSFFLALESVAFCFFVSFLALVFLGNSKTSDVRSPLNPNFQ